MKPVVDFVINHPEAAFAVLALLESAIMPIIPVKWNGVAVSVFNFLKNKKVEGK